MAKIFQAPSKESRFHYARHGDYFHVFTAGSIEMGAAEHWQERLVHAFDDEDHIAFFNPRRDDWDSSWVQSIDNPQFNEQVTWELEHIDYCDAVVFYFDPNTKSPITLLELGLVAGLRREQNWRANKPVIVFCPEGYWRKGNVDIVCDKFNLTRVSSWKDLELELLDEYVKFRNEILKGK